ncbi:16S rRNA (guanine(966)-N(2))-methyltransferase RsmD [Marixanthomonas spongiae]|uniref:16S rRNA (Guanine(966)-N(2))-methyltransferase RsmD n=1 Tax=Marixanthomonas spongiae TaxID=2174845 RepID=A0A2U0HY44_9FLAO|nr:16S rRNA (guanine(966)-N(2))-methyltransferase RsmD [Marixanthomonas spongiae]PVW13784.1 16S rRNA (guanine(966)-N(2))-methyltransferase RsmD [Marixanthomonas spongiae]
MRIISGTHKGRRLIAPKTLPVRPTTDFAKEALFNILRNSLYFEEINVLDLFAGTGNISYEFASRGTQHITAVDAHPACVKFIKETAETLDFPIDTVKSDVVKYLSAISATFDIIFADPPYKFDNNQFEEIIATIFRNNLTKPNGMVIIEHSKETDLSHLPYFKELRKYGGSVFSFFQ